MKFYIKIYCNGYFPRMEKLYCFYLFGPESGKEQLFFLLWVSKKNISLYLKKDKIIGLFVQNHFAYINSH